MSGWFASLTGLTLVEPAFLWGLLAVPAAFLLRRLRGSPAVTFAPAAFARAAAPALARRALAVAPQAAQALGVVCAVTALARPVSRDPLPPEIEGTDIVLVLDVSSSMKANDLDPVRSRHDVAKAAAARFAAERPHDRTGLVCFARYPDLRCPPTLDHEALSRILADSPMVEFEGPEDATGLGTALALAARTLRRSDAKSRTVVLLTDGVENVATAEAPEEITPIHAAQLCRELGVRVYAVAAGLGERAPNGEFVKLDTAPLRRAAELTGGAFFEARDADAVTRVFERINALERASFKEARTKITERFAPFLAAALALFAIGFAARPALGGLP